MMTRSECRAYKFALVIASAALGFMFMAWAKERSTVCTTRYIVPSNYCYTWSDGFRQCRKPKEIDV